MSTIAFRASFAHLLRHPWQLVLAIVGIAVGVGVIVAVDLANSSARKAFLLSMDAITGDATHQIIGGPRGVPESVYSDLRVRHGIRAMAPVVEGTVFINDARLTLLGIDLFAEQNIRSYSFTTQNDSGEPSGSTEALFGQFISTPGTVVMSGSTMTDLGLKVGQTFELAAAGRTVEASMIARIAEIDSGSLERVLIADIATAQEWLNRPGWLSRVDVRMVEDERAVADLREVLPAGTRLLTAAGRTRATADMSSAFMTNLTAMSLLALLVGIFLIFNSVNFSVLQRRNLVGVLRAIGLTGRQLMTILLSEAVLIGLVSAVLGIALGIVLGEALLDLVSRTINDLYFRVTVTTVQVESISILKGLAAGVGAALLAAALPAWEAISWPPRLAMTRSVLERRARLSVPFLTFAGVGVMALALLLIVVSATDLTAGLAAVLLLILGFGLLIPVFVRFVTNKVIPLAARLGGISAKMAVAGITDGLSRTAVAVVALTVAVSATVGVSVMVDSFRDSVNRWLQQTLQADLYAGNQSGPMAPDLVETLRRIEGIEAVSTNRRASVETAEGRTQLRVIEMAPGSYAGTEILDADPGLVWPEWETEDVVLVSEPYAFQNRVNRGDIISLPTDRGDRRFEIAATFQSYDVNASAVLMSRSVYARHFDDPLVDSVGLYLRKDVDPDEVIENVGMAGRSSENPDNRLRVISNADIRTLSLRIFDRTFVITDVLYWLALGVAFIGILSAMLALQLERTRELATLRALGMTPRQVGGMIVTQTGVIGLISGLAAIPMGIVMAVVLIRVINRRAFGWQIDISIAPDILAVAVGFAIVASVLAGLYPAWRAGRNQPAIAMREE